MVVDRDGTNVHPITDSTGTETFGGWSSDGRQTVLLRSQPDGTSLVLVADADGRNARSLSVAGATGEASWSVNGLRLLIGIKGGLLIVDQVGDAMPQFEGRERQRNFRLMARQRAHAACVDPRGMAANIVFFDNDRPHSRESQM